MATIPFGLRLFRAAISTVDGIGPNVSESRNFTPEEIGWLVHDLEEEQEDRAQLRRDLGETRTALSRIYQLLGIDPEDEKAVSHIKEQLKSWNRYKSRRRTGRLRVGEDTETTSIAHYEAKLTAKKSEIRRLSMADDILRKLFGDSHGYVDLECGIIDISVSLDDNEIAFLEQRYQVDHAHD
jgi:hypothetical protein